MVSSIVKKVTLAAVSVPVAGMFFAVPAQAGPIDNPCQLTANPFCQFLPIAPNLEGDVDLTQQLPPADPNAPDPASLPPVDPCAMGCR